MCFNIKKYIRWILNLSNMVVFWDRPNMFLTSWAVHCDRWSVYSVVQGSEVAEMPSWMDNLYKKFSSSACPFNIQLFIAKLILNTDEVKVVHMVDLHQYSLF